MDDSPTAVDAAAKTLQAAKSIQAQTEQAAKALARQQQDLMKRAPVMSEGETSDVVAPMSKKQKKKADYFEKQAQRRVMQAEKK